MDALTLRERRRRSDSRNSANKESLTFGTPSIVANEKLRRVDSLVRHDVVRLARKITCPYCGHTFATGDLDGADALQKCPECGGKFAATVGAVAQHDATFVEHLHGVVQFAVVAWTVPGERYFYFMGPPPLLLREGDVFSLVYDECNKPVLLINHSLSDHAWALGSGDQTASVGGELNAGRALAALVVWALVVFGAWRGGAVAGAATALWCAGALLPPLVLARPRGRSRVRWLLGSLATLGAAGFVLALSRSERAQGEDAQFFRLWIPTSAAALSAVLAMIDLLHGTANGAGVWLVLSVVFGGAAVRLSRGARGG